MSENKDKIIELSFLYIKMLPLCLELEKNLLSKF